MGKISTKKAEELLGMIARSIGSKSLEEAARSVLEDEYGVHTAEFRDFCADLLIRAERGRIYRAN